MDILGELDTEGTTIMVVTHDAKIAARTSRVLYLVDGRIVGDRHQGRYVGTGMDRRHLELTAWLLEQDQDERPLRPRDAIADPCRPPRTPPDPGSAHG